VKLIELEWEWRRRGRPDDEEWGMESLCKRVRWGAGGRARRTDPNGRGERMGGGLGASSQWHQWESPIDWLHPSSRPHLYLPPLPPSALLLVELGRLSITAANRRTTSVWLARTKVAHSLASTALPSREPITSSALTHPLHSITHDTRDDHRIAWTAGSGEPSRLPFRSRHPIMPSRRIAPLVCTLAAAAVTLLLLTCRTCEAAPSGE